MKREDEWEAEKFEALNDEFQISNTGESGDWAEDVLFQSKGGKKKATWIMWLMPSHQGLGYNRTDKRRQMKSIFLQESMLQEFDYEKTEKGRRWERIEFHAQGPGKKMVEVIQRKGQSENI